MVPRPIAWVGSSKEDLKAFPDSERNAYRAVYTVKFAEFVYVLHCFQEVEAGSEDTQQGSGPDQVEAAHGGGRLQGKKGKHLMAATRVQVSRGSGNVFRDLGLKNSEELLAKTKLAVRIVQIVEERKLSQRQAAKVLGIDQPKVSQIYRGRLDDFSLERLMRFLTALDQDIRIVVEHKPRRGRGRVIVEAA